MSRKASAAAALMALGMSGAVGGAGCGSAPQRPWIEEEIGGGAGELGQSRFDEDVNAGEDNEGGAGELLPGAEAAPVGTDAAAALRELEAALAAIDAREATRGGVNDQPGRGVPGQRGRESPLSIDHRGVTAATWGRLERALAGLPPAAVARLEAGAVRRADSLGGAAVALHLARLALHGGARERAAPQLGQAAAALSSAAGESELHAALTRQLAELTAAAGAPAAVQASRIAVLLPLSGRFAAVGQELRRAIELSPAGVQWQFLDTRGEPGQAAAMAEQAADGGAVAVLGPVGDREAVAAARRAAQRGLPIALLAPGDGGDAGLGVFRLAWSVEDEARAVAAWAAANDFTSVAVLAPRDDVGELAATAFAAAARRLGLTLAATGQYDAAGGSVEADLKRFLGLVPAQNPRLAAHLRRGGKRAWQTFVPDVAFSLLYVPDRADRAALVAAFLPYLGIELRTEEIMDPLRLRRKYRGVIPQVVQLVGGAGWNTPSLPSRGGKAVQGAMIFDVCTAQRDDLAAELAGQLEARLGHAPSSAAAQAYDAASWLGTAVAAARAAGRGHRAGVRAQLAQARLEEGACGPLAIGGDGEVVREPAVLQVDGEDLVLAP